MSDIYNPTSLSGTAISGSTIDNSVIGGTTPAAGTFTTLISNTAAPGTNSTANANTAFYWANLPTTFRNAVINSDASLAQRGATITGISSITQGLDCWFGWCFSGASNATMSQQAGISGFANLLRMQRINGNTSVQGHSIAQIIETQDCLRFQGVTATYSFYARAGANFSATGNTLNARVDTGTGTNQGSTGFVNLTWTNQAVAINTTQVITTTLTRYSFSVSIPANATEIGVQLYFTPTGTAGVADYFEVTGVQFEANPLTVYEYTPTQIQLERCMRFYQKSFATTTAPAQSAGVSNAITVKNPIALGDPSEYIQFCPPMRTTPTITTFNPSAANANWRDITASADATVSVDPATTIGSKGVIIATSGTITTLGDVLAIHYTAEAAL